MKEKDQKNKTAKKTKEAHRHRQHRSKRHHEMLAPLITVAILVAHLFTFRQFSFALIDLKNVKT